MSTFAELQSKLTSLKYKKEVISYVIQHLEDSFMPVAGGDSKKKLLDDNRNPIPPLAIEDTVFELNSTMAELTNEIEAIMKVNVDVHTAEKPIKKAAKKAENVQGEQS